MAVRSGQSGTGSATSSSGGSSSNKVRGSGARVTVKGSPITKSQADVATTILGVGTQHNAPHVALVASMYAAMGETSLGADNYKVNNGAGYWGVLQGSVSSWPNPNDIAGQAQAFFTGKGPQGQTDFHTGAINFAKQGMSNPAEIAIKVEVPSIWPNDAYAKEWSGGALQGTNEARAIVTAYSNGGVPDAAAASSGQNNAASNGLGDMMVGAPGAPNEDYWTAINRMSMAAYWYVFSDAETLYLADGIELMQQDAAASVARLDDARVVNHLSYHWDNTAFNYSTHHPRHARLARRTTLSKVTSPVEGNLNLVCPIDMIRAGDVTEMSQCGPGDGRWLVGNSRRSIFQIYSELTLVPAVTPMTESEINQAGVNTNNKNTRGQPASGFTNPFPNGWAPNRLDAGFDGTFKGEIVAPFSGKIMYASEHFSNWGGFITLLSDQHISGLPSDLWYFAEGVHPTVQGGDKVSAGDRIAVGGVSPYGNAYGTNPSGIGQIEFGLAQDSQVQVNQPSDPLAYIAPNPAKMVRDWADWCVKNLGIAGPTQTSHAGYA